MSANEDSCVNVTRIPFGDAFATMTKAMQELGGRMKANDPASGTLEASWRHGINMFGLRVTARFRALDDGQVEVTVKGGFKDAFDTTGAGRRKAVEVLQRYVALVAAGPVSGDAQLGGVLATPPIHRHLSKTEAALLALFLGGVGAHRFYLGSWGIGLVYVLALAVHPALGALAGLAEAIRFFSMNAGDFDRQYNYRVATPLML
jgi:TM2 domain-containing membrane protein YozV